MCEILWCSPLTLSPHPRFESVQYAQKAKAALNGADIYAGCCTLKIEYARVSSINSELFGRLFPTKCDCQKYECELNIEFTIAMLKLSLGRKTLSVLDLHFLFYCLTFTSLSLK